MWRFERYSERKKRKSPFSTTPLSFDAPSQGNPREYLHKTYLARNKDHLATFLPLTVWVYLHANFSGWPRKTCVNATECIIAVQGHFGSTKVVDLGTNRKRVYDFLLVINSNLCRISHRFGGTTAYWSKIANSYPPHPHSTPSFGVTPFEFWDDRDIPRN